MTKPKSEILTITDVAEYLKAAKRTPYHLGAAKKIPAFKVGDTWRFSKTEIESMDKAAIQQIGLQSWPNSLGRSGR